MEIKNKKNNFQYLKLCFCIIFCIYIENPLIFFFKKNVKEDLATRLGTVSKNDNCSIIKKKKKPLQSIIDNMTSLRAFVLYSTLII